MGDVLAAAHGRVGTCEVSQLVAECEGAGQPRAEGELAAARPAIAPVTSACSSPATPPSSPAPKIPGTLVCWAAPSTTRSVAVSQPRSRGSSRLGTRS
jgi:hypothetical protein